MDPNASEFWSFAQAVYARPGVAPLCLELQDRHGANVMVLLFLCWSAARGAEADPEILARAAACIALPDGHLVAPLRAARRTLAQAGRALESAPLAQTAKRVHAAELEAELAEAVLLAQLAPPPAPLDGEVERAARALELALDRAGVPAPEARALSRELATRMLPVEREPRVDMPPVGPRV